MPEHKGTEMKAGADLYQCWLAALRHMLSKTDMQQNVFAKSIGTHPSHLNAILKERLKKDDKPTRAGEDLRYAAAEYFGYTYIDFLELGNSILEGVNPTENKEEITREPEWEIHATGKKTEKISDQLGKITVRIRELEDENTRLKAGYEYLNDGIVIIEVESMIIEYQNSSHRRLYGTLLGQSCRESDYCPMKNGQYDECLADLVVQSGRPVTRTCEYMGKRLSVSASPIMSAEGIITKVINSVRICDEDSP
ncbi:MAG: hypothetical protein SCH71_17025 [Desulfobulbaceae bacterium]|nr:hypothetical protein [Desulfobulbaceae bacterium]